MDLPGIATAIWPARWPRARPATRKKIAPPTNTAFGARLAYTEQIRMGQNSALTITDEDVAVSFAYPAGEAAWKAAGQPPTRVSVAPS